MHDIFSFYNTHTLYFLLDWIHCKNIYVKMIRDLIYHWFILKYLMSNDDIYGH